MREISFSLLVEKIFEEKMACIQCWINEKARILGLFASARVKHIFKKSCFASGARVLRREVQRKSAVRPL